MSLVEVGAAGQPEFRLERKGNVANIELASGSLTLFYDKKDLRKNPHH